MIGQVYNVDFVWLTFALGQNASEGAELLNLM